MGWWIPTNGLIFGIFLLSALCFPTLSAAQMENASEGLSANVIDHLLNSSKIKRADAVLKDFLEEGATTTRVIVNLQEAEVRSVQRVP
jgi:hypothetical protein